MNTLNQEPKLSYKHVGNIADSLYVLSQLSLKQKLLALNLTKEVKEGRVESESLQHEVEQKIKSILKNQQYFHAERQIIIHYLLNNNIANFNSYVVVKGVSYGLIRLKKYKMYCIVNKKLIKKFNAKQTGEAFSEMPLLDNNELDKIIAEKEAKRIFKLYYNEVLRNNKKKGQNSKQSLTVKKHVEKEQILGSTKSSTGNVVVIKRKRFSVPSH